MNEPAAIPPLTAETPTTLDPVRPVGAGHMVPWFDVWRNPIAQRCRRARLRGRHLLIYGVLGFTVIGFVFLVTYLWPVYQLDRPRTDAAKAALFPMLLIQGVVLMGMGTMALATGIARERDRDLLDYQRMTPLSPTTKILGYLFGLPSREYFLFALTVPFVLYAAWVAELSWLRLGKYYAVFFSAVCVYHMTGLCAGMVSRKPWQSAVVSVGMVVVLYLVLPQLSYVGLWVFEYLTIYPTFFTLIAEVIQAQGGPRFPGRVLRMYDDVRFFNWTVNPLWFSLLLQGGMLLTLFTVVRRKWIDAGWHSFSKPFGLLFVVGVHVLLVGTLWSTLSEGVWLRRVASQMSVHAPGVFGWLMGLYVGVSAAALLFVTFLITPDRHTALRGHRRARKAGRSVVPAAWDAAPALRWVVGSVVVVVLGYAALIAVARGNDRLFQGAMEWRWIAAPMFVLVPTVLLFHGLAERLKARFVLLALFGLWVFPIMVGVIVAIVSRDHLPVLYLGSPSPAMAGVLSLVAMTFHTGLPDRPWDDEFEREVLAHVPAIQAIFVVLTSALALFVQINRARWSRRWRAGPENLVATGDVPEPTKHPNE